jgi:hypothetical protein
MNTFSALVEWILARKSAGSACVTSSSIKSTLFTPKRIHDLQGDNPAARFFICVTVVLYIYKLHVRNEP